MPFYLSIFLNAFYLSIFLNAFLSIDFPQCHLSIDFSNQCLLSIDFSNQCLLLIDFFSLRENLLEQVLYVFFARYLRHTGHHDEQLRPPSRERDDLLYGGTIRENIGGDREPSKRKKSAKSSYAHREGGKGNYGSRRGSNMCACARMLSNSPILFTHHVRVQRFLYNLSSIMLAPQWC